MDLTEIIIKYRRFLKRVNYSKITVQNYFFNIKQFSDWLKVPIDEVTFEVIFEYIGFLHNRRLKPKTINSYLNGIRKFYNFLKFEERINVVNPVKSTYRQILPKPLPKFLKEQEIKILFDHITDKRDNAMFMLMLRCGLRVGEVSNLTFHAIDFERKSILVLNGKFRKDRIIYMSNDAIDALKTYIKVRPPSRARKVFLVQRGFYRGKPLSIRSVQKRMEYYAKETGLTVSCHRLRHTMATQLLNADAMLATVQELMVIWSSKNGHPVKRLLPNKNYTQKHLGFYIPKTNGDGDYYKTFRYT